MLTSATRATLNEQARQREHRLAVRAQQAERRGVHRRELTASLAGLVGDLRARVEGRPAETAPDRCTACPA
jgi:hypothetical protein